MSIDRALVDAALAAVVDPNTGRPYAASKGVRNVAIDGDAVTVDVVLGYPAKSLHDDVRAQVAAALKAVPGVRDARVNVSQEIVAHTAQRGVKLMPNVKNIVAVASGKGGVGKSTTSVNLALGMKANGLRVGLLDADIYGPSMPRMMAITGKPNSADGKMLQPMENYGVKVMSMGFLVAEDTPMIWRGPMVQSALQQMLRDVAWGELDVLVVDLPPGTGDAQLTMAQQVPLAGAVIVSTPQDIALLDARKGLNMFRRVDVPVLGIVENMSYFCCPNCGHRTDIFSHGGAKREAESLGMEFLGEIPLDIAIRETSDDGQPIVMSQPDSEHAKVYRRIAARVWEKVAGPQRGTPKIVIE